MVNPEIKNFKNAFTLVELILVIIVIGIVFSVASRNISTTLDEARYRATVEELGEISKALVGDENVIEGHSRTDLGVVGQLYKFPAPSGGALPSGAGSLLEERFANNLNFSVDAWGNDYVYSVAKPTIEVKSLGADGTSGTPDDIYIKFKYSKYYENTVVINCYDLRGNILLGNEVASGGTNDYHITRINLINSLAVSVTATCSNSVFSFLNVPCGKYSLVVDVADNSSSGGTNWRSRLNEGNLQRIYQITVYPREGINFIPLRLNGSVMYES